MKKYILSVIVVSFYVVSFTQVPNSGFLFPRVTTAERVAMSPNIANGIHVYDITTNSDWIYTGENWARQISANVVSENLNPTSNTSLNNLYINNNGLNEGIKIDNDGNVGVNVANPSVNLDVAGYLKVGSSDEKGDSTPVNGMIRYNLTSNKFEKYDSGSWILIN